MANKRKSSAQSGTLGALIEIWKKSANWTELAPSSQARYQRILNHLLPLHNSPLELIERGNILHLRDQFAPSPSTANGLASVVSTLFTFAVDRGYAKFSPAVKIKRLKVGRHERWTDAQLDRILTQAKDPIRRATLLAVETGQRRGDLIAAAWTQFDGEFLTIRQQKTGQLVDIPATERLSKALKEWKADRKAAVTILTNSRGRPWTFGGFGASWEAEMKRLGLSGVVTFHGLRATFLCRLAEAGVTPHEMMAISGHQTLKQIEHYTRDVNRKHNASAAIVLLEDRRNKMKAAGDG